MRPPLHQHYHTVIIGCGMSGLAAGIRLAQFGRSVIILERHNAPGGLNSFYSIAGRKFDVGLHAVTNYVPAGVRGTPLGKICRQLRIDRDALDLCPQLGSRIAFPGIDLRFTNEIGLLEAEISREFPREIDRFRMLIQRVREFDDTRLDATPGQARRVLNDAIADPVLREMLLCPLMYYGSARPRDMDFDQFVTLFKALYLEGFARPWEGVRRIIRVLLSRFKEAGGERRMKCGVRRFHTAQGRIAAIELDDGSMLTADHVLSSIGRIETERMLRSEGSTTTDLGRIGPLSFAETITVLNSAPIDLGCSETIVFFNDSPTFEYAAPEDDFIDDRSGVICFPNNYDYGSRGPLKEGVIRITALASHKHWSSLDEISYRDTKSECAIRMRDSALRFLPTLNPDLVTKQTCFTDMFTPLTIERFTGHLGGAVYGSPDKVKAGTTDFQNLYLCGTDQGFLGIIGAMLSGISMANLHILGKGN